MTFPFGGHPQFGHYMQWAQTQGCQVNCSFRVAPNGETVNVTRITSADGKRWAIEAMEQTEYLTPTTIGRLNRRLGLAFPEFPPFDDQPGAPGAPGDSSLH